MANVLKTLKVIYSFYTMIFIVGCGLFTFIIAQGIMRKKGFKKEEKITKIAGMTYMVGGVLIYFILMFFK